MTTKSTAGRKPAPATDNTGTEAAARVADVLLLFAGGPRYLGVSAISRELGLSKAVVFRILQSLVSRELLATDPDVNGYRLGQAAAALGASALRRFDARTVATPILRRLRDETGETTTLSGLVGDERVYLDQFESPREIKMTVEIGRRFPLHAGSSGKVILAFLPEERQEALLHRPLDSLTDKTITDLGALRTALAEAAREGVAVSLGERQAGAGSVAAPLFGPDGEVHGSISICGPQYRFTPEAIDRYRGLVRAASDEIRDNWTWLRESNANG
ncbi:IclR family transcriptional regulator [Amycolatopsis endophytica]|uniref:DNA-binding IclR family transcriptional regulator n=1 Tax=Amycolatopsis endophytica TaxID=860233 RepID=A0A853AX63_9PSEU|nr:IclR family transcriptional regulator [Amycolatopsis endophytica]NYI87204.1 DNA-binding IclR family transcriptional regulator [Amycolatopsis endophytica]